MLINFDAVLNTAGEKEPILLENLLFSLNMSLPLFIVMGLGCILTHKGFFTENYIAHTTNLVPFYIVGADVKLRDGRLADIAPTMLDLMGLEKPAEMDGETLIEN